ncbi:MAG: D-alanyl-D-alanine carboxypeptidase/D-alanyl-D-alanine-endopeptidase, partial [Myxococcales bacterium]|nr:D-alanyl-D-alanine carboxypeptidase/D-alanyl-D-alanine-endopeptidase [Myxococcales bacterium]
TELAEKQVLEDVLGPIAADRLFTDAQVAIQVVEVATGEEVWSRNADLALNPASTTKIVTAATALRTLGPAYVFRTVLSADALPDAKGVIEGPLYVRGGGDPTMVVEKLWRLARDLELAGVTRVKGGLVLDESMFGPDHALPGWDKERDVERGPSYFPALSALSLNFNTEAIVVRPGESGKPAVVLADTPAPSAVEIVSTVKTGRPGSRHSVEIEREVKGGRTVYTVSGYVPEGAPVRRYHRTVDDPTAYFGAAFQALLTERGIQVDGAPRVGVTPDDSEYLAE